MHQKMWSPLGFPRAVFQKAKAQKTENRYLYSTWILTTPSAKHQKEEQRMLRTFSGVSGCLANYGFIEMFVRSTCKVSMSLETVLLFSGNKLLNVVMKTPLLHLHNILWSLKRLQLASLPLCGASSSDTADVASSRVHGILGRRTRRWSQGAEHPSEQGQHHQWETKALGSCFPAARSSTVTPRKPCFILKNCIRIKLNILPGKFVLMWMEKIFITYILAPSRRSE